uniref:Uncharacterized protein n=1 Tax=Romanomermis culicivorax TaxID=13658 RepID=A0A915KRQ0_ROMCU
MEIEYGLRKDEEAAPAVEKKLMELPSPMKVDDDITTNKLIIDKNVAETPEPEMVESKE